ncbi:L-serine ammonia-lyase, iron-sulfur-dependent subunit beta [Paenibacillus urinalis]|uniref:L-serine deaminase n=1 Tax=Paenibacillus urinalis TaxID=521520 RepID=A0ABY7XD43_9BACL|nr:MULTISPECIES: L-serine ammonia-lyase, iron-sulfur-dependent subunit beta [Paenibacillus]WDH99068.1 L-serine ammonia-lyase, iron-sulfur-dependent subunit beta [Paenibacillus urinalis]WDI02759.1 L-serine ammonia-lyase, iron-sulfur-dependent subunit beta [Paenibacillus urinalis]GAK40250.1 L-serine dehydratase, iron-sulfur-dependent subunit beta [Paenibacillus sp. TCA20]
MMTRFKDVFSIIGPAMTGPSSSHTAGAVRLGRIARQWLGTRPEKAKMILYGSFADTYTGHGTDLALISGLMNMATDDERIPNAEEWAEQLGMEYEFVTSGLPAAHPNTVKFELSAGDRACTMVGASIGGGNVTVSLLDDFRVQLTGDFPAVVLRHSDKAGVIASVTSAISESGVNIGFMQVDRKGRDGEALTAMETDTIPASDVLNRLKSLPHIYDIKVIDLKKGDDTDAV